jgi:hypothetical protein
MDAHDTHQQAFITAIRLAMGASVLFVAALPAVIH